MRIYILLLAACITSTAGVAQQREIDSLEKILNSHANGDSTRLKALADIAYSYYQVDPEKGLVFATEAVQLAEKLKMDNLAAKGNLYMGLNYWALGQYDEALRYEKKALEIYESLSETKLAAKTNNSIAVVYMSLADYSKALDIYWKNLHFFETIKDTALIAVTYGNMGLVYKNLGKNNEAIGYHQKAIAINEHAGNNKALADNYNNIGNAYDNADNPAKAIEYYKKELAISQAINYTRGIASSLSNMGIAYTTQANYAEGYKYLLQSLPMYKKTANKLGEAVVLKSTGDIFLQAPDNFFETQHLAVSKKYVLAKQYFDSSLQLYIELEDPSGEAELWEKISAVYEKQHDFSQSLQAYKKYVVLKDSVINDEKNQAILQMKMKYNFEKREDSLKAAHEKKALLASAEIKSESTIKKSIAWGSGILLSAALVSFIFYKKRRDAKQKQTEAEFKTEVADTEMKALRAQMNPHFIFNSLNSISDYIAKNDVPLADKYLSKFAKLMRMILENSEQKDVPLADDLKALELYMQLEALRMNNKFSYEIKVDDTIDKGNTMIPPLILQPFVENSIWHGIAKKEGPGKILIHIKKEGDDMINCMVEDDGVGRKQSAFVKTTTAQTEKTSLGMKITQSRIDILNKIKNTKAAVQLSDLAQGMRVEVKLPLATNF